MPEAEGERCVTPARAAAKETRSALTNRFWQLIANDLVP